MEDLLKRLVDGFSSNPLGARRAMLELLGTDRSGFGKAAAHLLRDGNEGPGSQFLTTILISQNLLVDLIARPDAAPLEGAIVLARRGAKMDPLLEVKLVRRLMDSEQSVEDGGEGVETRRLLEVLGGLSSGPRVANLLHRLQDSRNPRIRSKAALLLGKAFHDPRRAVQQLAESDARVRANAIEALWGATGAEWVEVFRTAARDPNNRVRANGWLGLYFAGETEAVTGLEEMARHPQHTFRHSAYWAIAQTGDPRFLYMLQAAGDANREMCEEELAGWKSASKRLSECYREARSRPPLDVFLHGIAEIPAEEIVQRRASLSVVRTEGGGPVKGLGALQFIIGEDGVPVNVYSAQEVRPPDALAVAFVMPRNREFGDKPVTEGLAAAAKMHRRMDQWTVARYADGFAPRSEDLSTEVRFSPDSSGWVLSAPGFRGPTAPGLLPAIHTVTPVLGVQRGTRHLIAVAGFDPAQQQPETLALREVIAELTAARVTFHAVVPSTAPLGVLLAVQSACRATGGWCAPNTAADQITDALRRIAISILHRYDLAWKSPKSMAALSVDVISPAGYACLALPGTAS